jgi:1-acyl-sn-glycerol-3-phosphate acyltransferase
MIKAKHNKYARLIFSAYLNTILKKDFSHFYIVNEIPELPADKAILITPNHISWWDGFFIDYINRRYFKRTIFIMMLEEQLKIYKYFRMVGAYSINPGHKKEITKSLSYTSELLSEQENLVVFYPEGVLKPFDTKPGALKKGLMKLAKSNSASFAALPVAFKLSFYNERKPEIYAYFGPIINADLIKNDITLYEGIFNENIKAVHTASLQRSFLRDMFQ